MNKAEITSVLSELYNISGFRVSLHGINFEEIAAYPEEKLEFCSCIQRDESELSKCVECDKISCERVNNTGETIIYRCRHGLIEAISPLYNFGVLSGYLMMGQVITSGESHRDRRAALIRYGTDEAEAGRICDDIPIVREDKINSYVRIMTICTQYLTLSNAVTSTAPTIGELAMNYISKNYERRIGIKDICAALGYSKSTVLSAFKKEYGTTVNARLNDIRLVRAKKMLEDGEYTIYDVAISCGFADQSYFSKVFSAKYGITPSDYRKGLEEK